MEHLQDKFFGALLFGLAIVVCLIRLIDRFTWNRPKGKWEWFWTIFAGACFLGMCGLMILVIFWKC